MDRSLLAVLEILDVFFDVSRRVDGEDVAVASEVVERVAVYSVWGLLGGKEKDGTCLRVSIICSGCEGCQ